MAFQVAGNANSASQWCFPYLYWTFHEYLVSQSPSNYSLPMCSFALGWLSGVLPTAVSQSQISGSDKFPAQSTCPLVLPLHCRIPFFLTFFPLWPATDDHAEPASRYLSYAALKSHAQETSGSSPAVWDILSADYLWFILLRSGTKPWKSHLTNPSSPQIQITHLSPLLRREWFLLRPPAWSWLSWGHGHWSGLLFPLLIALSFISPQKRNCKSLGEGESKYA